MCFAIFSGLRPPRMAAQPQAQCGCCTVLMDGKPVLSCALSPAKAEGKSITTLEGLDEEHRQQISESFVRCGGVQCGFCIPGMAMRGVGLCDKTPSPSREEIATALKPHLCRCTGTRRSSTASSNTPSCAAANRCPSHRHADQLGPHRHRSATLYRPRRRPRRSQVYRRYGRAEHAVRRCSSHRSSSG